MNRQINIMELLKLYAKRWWCLLLAVILCGTISGVYTKLFIKEQYTSYGTLYTENSTDIVSQDITEVNLNTVMVRKELVATYAEVLSSNSFLRKVAEESNLGYTGSAIHSMVKMTDKNSTEILVISVTSNDPTHSHIIAQKIIDLAPSFVSEIVEGGNVKPLDLPVYSDVPSSPNLMRNIQVGALIGLLLSLIIVFIIEMLDNKIKDTDTITETFKYPILGEVPYFLTTVKKDTKSKTAQSESVA